MLINLSIGPKYNVKTWFFLPGSGYDVPTPVSIPRSKLNYLIVLEERKLLI